MAIMFGRFDIQSELSKSDTALIYKAADTKTDQVVALKTQSLKPLGDRADAFVETLIAEGESAADLASQNIVVLYGAGEIDSQFCAAMEYIQGNSIATMLARKEGFSIWDLLDITRQLGAGLEQAASKGVAHCSLEPAKIMVQWDGTVKILGYGISNMSLIEAEAGNGLGRLMPYCSPEQIRGETIDPRSNVFSLGTILYEMVAGRKAFDAADPVALLSQIENEMPPSPATVGAKIHPGVSALIMKALAKNPVERYQSARELVDDLEQCKENSKKAATDTRKSGPAPNVAVSQAARAAAASKFVAAEANVAKTETSVSSAPSVPSFSSVLSVPVKPVAPVPVSPKSVSPAETKVAAAAAGSSKISSAISPMIDSAESLHAKSDTSSNSNSGARLVSDSETNVSDSQVGPGPVLSAAAVGPANERHSPRVAVDPMMAEPMTADPMVSEPFMSESGSGSSGKSFSDLAEMPPLKEPVFAPSFIEPAEQPHSVVQIYPKKKEEKPKIQPREVAQKAMHQIATVPPRLVLYSIMGAVGLILMVAIAVLFHVRSEDDGTTAAPQPTKAASQSSASSSTSSSISSSTPSSAQPGTQTAAAPRIEKPVPPPMEAQPRLTVRQIEKHNSNNRRASAPPPAPVAIPGEALIDSSPQGAQFQVDGKSDPAWVTPFNVTNLGPGKHIVSANKSGYSPEIRSVDVAAGGKSSLLFHLAPMNALVVLNSTPAGAEVIIDGRPTGRVTPAQFAVEKGSHTVLLRKQGYLDETVTADLGPAQNFQFAPVLKALGNTEDMRTVGKFNRLFGRGGESAAGMGSIIVRTMPRGAQVAINQQVLDKLSPVSVVVGPGNYIVDITLTGFKPVHKVISVDKGGKTPIDEILERQ
jgi:eukaryotic-like serine/threonine-protein kinase